jgi:hypothetical protein
MSEVHYPERDALDPFREGVDGLGWAVRDGGAMPRTKLIGPLADGDKSCLRRDRSGRSPS